MLKKHDMFINKVKMANCCCMKGIKQCVMHFYWKIITDIIFLAFTVNSDFNYISNSEVRE